MAGTVILAAEVTVGKCDSVTGNVFCICQVEPGFYLALTVSVPSSRRLQKDGTEQVTWYSGGHLQTDAY